MRWQLVTFASGNTNLEQLNSLSGKDTKAQRALSNIANVY